ncbi:AGE family epimerase/isomerase [Mucilaginibacter sp. OK098]|uniref:AGE family epimerase/isomerase n=1 Tax=Mucilaginibacter sp. OK098 TaxID=1855297 RepID=UPI00091775E5|nr:AGE family epimerase/isomerase [Mucilaginibacter sp. OK098]SHM42875.1 mannobiose 2-epimerase [Mucilaginibacter sp. OK098]
MIKETNIYSQLTIYKKELQDELKNILTWWAAFTPDNENGGFYGKIDNDNQITAEAPKGSVLNARILWSFSAAYNRQPEVGYLEMAERAYQYILAYFIDEEQGGVYWSVDYKGKPLDPKKQVYAISFTIYALSEYYRASKTEAAKQKAIDLFYLLVEKAYDPVKTGYFEAFTKDWKPIDDLRLSTKDANEKKTMNTHLHVLEGYTNLFRIWPDKALGEHISSLLNNFFDHFIDKETGHLVLFFDEDWNRKGDLVSYGHDIEATWLLLEAAEVIRDEESIKKIKEITIAMADATIAGIDTDGGLWYEYEPGENYLVKEKHWWVQAEAMVGFFNAWQISNDEKYLDIALKNWEFIKDKILDKQNGEWFWGIDENGHAMQNEDKAGLWKCPYHNSRACLDTIIRLEGFS